MPASVCRSTTSCTAVRDPTRRARPRRRGRRRPWPTSPGQVVGPRQAARVGAADRSIGHRGASCRLRVVLDGPGKISSCTQQRRHVRCTASARPRLNEDSDDRHHDQHRHDQDRHDQDGTGAPAGPSALRLHHTAYVTKDQAATRAFYEDILGFPLLATWAEADELFGAERVYCHTFFGLADGSALAFFQFADESDQQLFDPDLTPSPFRHIAMKVTQRVRPPWPSASKRPAGSPRAPTCSSTGTAARSTPRIRTGCCSSSPSTCPRPTSVNKLRRADAHETLERWLAGDHTGNNPYR